MKKNSGSNHIGRGIALLALLAVLCIGVAELAACSHFAPDVYERVMAPLRAAAQTTADAGKAALDAAGRFCLNAACRSAGLAEQMADYWAQLAAPPVYHTTPVEPESTPSVSSSQPPATEPPITEVLEADGKQILTGGVVNIVYFCQADEEWADKPFGTDPIGPYGCGPTAMAMAVASLTGTDTDPAHMAAWAANHGYWARRSGSYHSIVRGTAQAFGLEVESVTERTADALYDALSAGDLLVALVGPGHFTEGGHFILLRGCTLGGDILVADPNSLERSLMLWDPQIILDELGSARDNGAPLWRLSVPNT